MSNLDCGVNLSSNRDFVQVKVSGNTQTTETETLARFGLYKRDFAGCYGDVSRVS